MRRPDAVLEQAAWSRDEAPAVLHRPIPQDDTPPSQWDLLIEGLGPLVTTRDILDHRPARVLRLPDQSP